MLKRILEEDFILSFANYGRENTFTLLGLKALFEYLEFYHGGADDNDYVLDVIALCCTWEEVPRKETLAEYKCRDVESLIEVVTAIDIEGSDNILIQE